MAIYMWRRRQYTPTNDTKLYLPIDSVDGATVYDHSWNGKNFIWTWTQNFETLTSWKRVAVFDGTNWIYKANWFLENQTKSTISLWLNYTTWWRLFFNRRYYNSRWYWYDIDIHPTTNKIMRSYGGGTTSTFSWVSWDIIPTKDEWNNIIFTQNWWACKIYINWTLMSTVSNNTWLSVYETPYSDIWCITQDEAVTFTSKIIWKMSDIIYEISERSANDTLDYYNNTKWDYWIS